MSDDDTRNEISPQGKVGARQSAEVPSPNDETETTSSPSSEDGSSFDEGEDDGETPTSDAFFADPDEKGIPEGEQGEVIDIQCRRAFDDQASGSCQNRTARMVEIQKDTVKYTCQECDYSWQVNIGTSLNF